MSSKPTLGYFNVHGLAQPIRYLLVIAEVDFNDKRYPFGEGKTLADMDSLRKHWKADKESLGLDFPNIPYWIDGDVKMTQSLAILRFLARKHDLYADNDQSLIRQEMFEQQFIDFRKNFSTSLLAKHSNGGPEFKQAKIEFIKTLPDQLKPISKFLGERRWFTGDKLNYVDIFAYETFDLMRLFSPGTLEQFNNLSQFITRFENIPAIKTYRNSKDFASIPFFIPIYQFILD